MSDECDPHAAFRLRDRPILKSSHQQLRTKHPTHNDALAQHLFKRLSEQSNGAYQVKPQETTLTPPTSVIEPTVVAIKTANKVATKDPVQLILETHLHHYSKGTTLTFEGDETPGLFFVISGWITVSKSLADGDRLIIDVLLPGEMIDPSHGHPEATTVQLEALTEADVAIVPRDLCTKLSLEHPRIQLKIDHNYAATLSRMSERMLRLGKASAESRIAFALCELWMRSTQGDMRDGVTFHLPMAQRHLADFTGLSPVHVCRTLRRLKRNGIVSVSEHMQVSIHKLDKLAAIAEIEPTKLRSRIVPAAQDTFPRPPLCWLTPVVSASRRSHRTPDQPTPLMSSRRCHTTIRCLPTCLTDRGPAGGAPVGHP